MTSRLKESIVNDIRAEKLCSTPNKNHIQRCQTILDNIDSLNFVKFVNTGSIMTIESIKDRYPHRKFKQDVKTVCRYVGGFCIEFVGKDKFRWNYHEDVDFKHVEMTLFNNIKKAIDEQ